MSDYRYNGPHFPPSTRAGQYHMYNFHHMGPYHHAQAALTYMLRDVDKENLGTLSDFKEMIFEQFGEEVVNGELDFEMGFYHNNKRVWV